jgi:ligand-binding sensor domain-containing protein
LKTYLAIFFCFFALTINAQNPVSKALNMQTGLRSNVVYNILQDKQGFIWLGHDKGLSRYDGNEFVHFTARAQQGKSVSNLLEIKGSIWCQDFSGNFYYTKHDSLFKEQTFKTSGAFLPAGVLRDSLLSVINYDTIRSFNPLVGDKLTILTKFDTQQAVFHSSSHSYFFSSNELFRFDGKSVDLVSKLVAPTPNFSFLIKINDTFYAFRRNEYPLAYEIYQQSTKPLAILKGDIVIQEVSLVEDEIWISTTNGAYCFDRNMNPRYNGECFFKGYSITKVIKDREQTYWFGTLNKGILLVSDMSVKIFDYNTEIITALSPYKDKNHILVSTTSTAVFAFNSEQNAFQTIISSEPKGEVVSLYYDKPQSTIITCANNISFYQNELKTREEDIAGKAIVDIDESNYVAAFSGGILLLQRNKNSILLPNWLKDKIIQLRGKTFLSFGVRGRAVLFDKTSKTLYTATAEGLKYYAANTNGTILLNQKPIFASSLCMLGGVLYAGTFSDGLVKIQNNIAETLNEKNKYITKNIRKICADSTSIWICGDESVQKYTVQDNLVFDFTQGDGFPSAETKDILVQNGKAFLATSSGLVVFETNKKAINDVPPLLSLRKFLVNDKEFLSNKALLLNPNENNVQLFFSVLSFKDNPNCVVSYKINENEWKEIPKGQRSLQFASLEAGQYRIEIRVKNEDNIFATENIVVTFQVKAPFYRKIWFYTLVLIAVLGAMYAYSKNRLKIIEKNNQLITQKMQLERELEQSTLASIKSQMNPHFLFNALNTIQSYIYTNDKENASMYLGKFSQLTRIILEMSNQETVSLRDETKALQLYMELETLRFEDKLTCQFEIDKSLTTDFIFIPPMLIQPYVENAIKHGLMHSKKKWTLQITITKTVFGIQVIIDDNGIGRKKSAEINRNRAKDHISFATNANSKRLEILNRGLSKEISLQIEDKQDEQGNSKGTKIILNIPYLEN